MIGIVIPAHNEEEHLSDCLLAIQQAVDELSASVQVRVLVVLDSCTDQSLKLVQRAGINYLQCAVRCVGHARDLGVRTLIATGARWIACTDADSKVDRFWLKQQLSHQPADVICGVVEVDSWQHLSSLTRQRYLQHYCDDMDHRHIHGANLSFSAEAYIKSGGFGALTCHEDVGLVKRMLNLQYKVIWSNRVRVMTSSRLIARTPQGFSTFLKQLETTAYCPET